MKITCSDVTPCGLIQVSRRFGRMNCLRVHCWNGRKAKKKHRKTSTILSRVTNNNWFWIWWFDLLTPSFTITLFITINYNNSQSIFGWTLLPWTPRTRSILFLVLRLTSDLRLDYLYSIEVDPQKTHPLLSNGYMRTTHKTTLPLLYLQRVA
jgi:hypothetical protein